MILIPVAFFHPSKTDNGSVSPADTHFLRLDTSWPSSIPVIARYAVGAVKQIVGLNSPIALMRCGGVACSRSSDDAPNRNGNSSSPPSAYVNASGGDPQKMSSASGLSM